MKPISLDALLMLSERDISDLFPCGAVQKGKKWTPAETEKQADKTLARLLRDKKARQEKPRFLVQAGPTRLRWSSKDNKWVAKEFTEDEEHGYTGNRDRALEPLEVVPTDVQEQQTKEAHERFDREHQEQIDRATVRSVLAGLRQIGIDAAKSGADPRLAIALAATKILETEKEAA